MPWRRARRDVPVQCSLTATLRVKEQHTALAAPEKRALVYGWELGPAQRGAWGELAPDLARIRGRADPGPSSLEFGAEFASEFDAIDTAGIPPPEQDGGIRGTLGGRPPP